MLYLGIAPKYTVESIYNVHIVYRIFKKVKAIYTDGTYKWVSIKSVDKYIADGYIIDYEAVGNTHKAKS